MSRGANGHTGADAVRSSPVQALLGGLLEERGVLSGEKFCNCPPPLLDVYFMFCAVRSCTFSIFL